MYDDLSALKKCRMANANFPLVQFPLTISLHPRFGFNMQVWLCLKHLCMDVYV